MYTRPEHVRRAIYEHEVGHMLLESALSTLFKEKAIPLPLRKNKPALPLLHSTKVLRLSIAGNHSAGCCECFSVDNFRKKQFRARRNCAQRYSQLLEAFVHLYAISRQQTEDDVWKELSMYREKTGMQTSFQLKQVHVFVSIK